MEAGGPIGPPTPEKRAFLPAIRPAESEKIYLMTFDELGLDPRILEAVTASGYTTPTPIQEQGIPAVLGGKDVTGIAQTGTGKTAAFVLPMILKL